MTVYVVQQPRPNKSGWMPDLSSAADYGNIEYVFSQDDRVYALPGPSLFKARQWAKDFNPEKDYLLWPSAGDPMGVILATIALTEVDADEIKLLYWDRKRNDTGQRDGQRGFYKPITINRKRKVTTV